MNACTVSKYPSSLHWFLADLSTKVLAGNPFQSVYLYLRLCVYMHVAVSFSLFLGDSLWVTMWKVAPSHSLTHHP
jgi:hypothetical protein